MRKVSPEISMRDIYPGWRSAAMLLSKDEARRITVNIAKLPHLAAQDITHAADDAK
jgi:hypothetical protein